MENANGVIKKLTSAERSYYTAAEVREMMGVSRDTAYRMIRSLRSDLIADGQLAKGYPSGKIPKKAFNKLYIQNNLSLHGYKYIDLKPKEKRSGNLRRYDVGSVAEINGLNNEQYFILGLTYFDNELRAHVEKIDYIKAIASLVKYISERSQGFSTYMPVIGTGGADAGSVNDLVVYIVKTIELFKDEIDCDIHIVVSDKEEKLGLMNLKML